MSSHTRTHAFLSALFPPPIPAAPPNAKGAAPADDLLPALALAAADDDKVDEIRDALALWVGAYVQAGRTSHPGRTLAAAQLDQLVLQLLHRYHEDASPSGRSFSPAPTLNQLLSKAGPTGSGTAPPPRRRPHPPPSRSNSNFGVSSPVVGAPSAWSSGAASPLPLTPRSSRPTSPSGFPPANTGSVWGRPSASVQATPTPIARPTRSSTASPAPVVPPAGVIGSPRPPPATIGTRGLHPETRTLSLAGSNTGSSGPTSPALGGASALSMTDPSAATGDGSTTGPSGLNPNAGTFQVMGSRPNSPAVHTTSPKLNLGAAEFTPRSGRSTPGGLTSPLAAAASRTAGAGPTTLPWSAIVGGSTGGVPPSAPESIASSHASSGSGFSFAPWSTATTTVGTQGESPPTGPMGNSSGAVVAEPAPTTEDEDDDDEFSPFAPARPTSTTPMVSMAPLASKAYLFPGEDTPPGPVPDGSVMAPLDVLCAILMGTQTSDEDSPVPTAGAYVWTRKMVESVLAQYNFDVQATLMAVLANHGHPPPPPAQPEFDDIPNLIPKGAEVPASMNPRLYFPEGPRGFSRGGANGVQVMTREAFAQAKSGAPTGSPARSTVPATATTPVAPSPITPGFVPGGAPPFPGGGTGGGGAARVCRYYLAGDCRRSDCRFSHDLSRALCKYWLRGDCLNAHCGFLHDYGALQSLASGMNRVGSDSEEYEPRTSAPATPIAVHTSAATRPKDALANDDFPSLDTTRRPVPGSATAKRGATGSAFQAPGYASAAQKKGTSGVQARGGGGTNDNSGSKSGARTTRRIALRPPTLLPTLETGSSVSNLYTKQRASTTALGSERAAALRAAASAYARGDGAGAHRWSRRATELNAQLGSERARSAGATLKQRHAELRNQLLSTQAQSSDEPGARGMRGKVAGNGLGVCLGVARRAAVGAASARNSLAERAEYLLDLHGLHASEAQELTEQFLLGLEEESVRGLAYLAVGMGKHTVDGQPNAGRLGTVVRHFLTAWNYPHNEVDGVIVVDPTSYS